MYDDIDWDRHAVIRPFFSAINSSSTNTTVTATATTTTTTITAPIMPINAYNNQQSTFRGETSLSPFLSGNSRRQTIDRDDNWDLNHLVKGFRSTIPASSSTIVTTTTPFVAVNAYNRPKSTSSGENFNLFQPNYKNITEELLLDPHDPFNFLELQEPPLTSQSSSISSISILKGSQDLSHQQQQQQEQFLHGEQQSFGISICTTTQAKNTIRSKKRKNEMKRICQVPYEEGLSTRYWRKYGQKPIKGSPYPRGYYRCSVLKDCSARKQVERNKSDPTMLIVTFTGEHNHPMQPYSDSSAGSTNKNTTNSSDNNKPTSSMPVSSIANRSIEMKTVENKSEDTNDDNVPNMVMDEDIFEGLDELVDLSAGGGFFEDQSEVLAASTAIRSFPSLPNNVAADEN